MSRYLNTVYGTDTYGIRLRTEIPMVATCFDYEKIRLDFGPFVQSEFHTGSRLVIAKSTFYWPHPPAAKGPPDGSMSTIIDPDVFADDSGSFPADLSILPPGDFSSSLGEPFQANFDSSVFFSASIGYDDIPSVFFDHAAQGSVVYYRAYVTEPLTIAPEDIPQVFQDHMDYLVASGQVADESEITGIWSPWEVRGQAYVVSVKDFGGEPTAIDAFPNGLLTNGDVYGIPDKQSTQYQFLTSLGWLSDIISTDGSLISDRPELSHPKLVRPLLKAFGMLPDEDVAVNAAFATWNQSFDSPRLKNLLYSYRDLTLRKGTGDATTDYLGTAYGLRGTSVSLPENLVLSTTDASPLEVTDATQVTADIGSGSKTYAASPAGHILPNSSVTVTGAIWSRQPVYDVASFEHGMWTDTVTRDWAAGPQDSLIEESAAPGEDGHIPAVVGAPGSADVWAVSTEEAQFYDQLTDYVYQIKVQPAGVVASFGTVSKDFYEPNYTGSGPDVYIRQKPDFQYSIPISDKVNKYWVRCRVMRQSGTLQYAYIVVDWLNEGGHQISRERFSVDEGTVDDLNTDHLWHELSNSVDDSHGQPPPGAFYLAWHIEFCTSSGDTAGAVVCAGAPHISWLDLDDYPTYRNPRSVVVLVDWADKHPTLDTRIALAKATVSIRDRLPANVDYRFLTSDAAAEFEAVSAGPPDRELLPYITFSDPRIEFGGDWRDAAGDPTGNNDVTFDQRDYPGS